MFYLVGSPCPSLRGAVFWSLIALLPLLVSAPRGFGQTTSVRVGRYPQEAAVSFSTSDGLPSNHIAHIDLDAQGNVWAETDAGWAVRRGGKWTASPPPPPESLRKYVDPPRLVDLRGELRQAVRGSEDVVVAATSEGLFASDGGPLERVAADDGLGRRWGSADVRGAAFDARGRLWFATLAGVACRTGVGSDASWRFFTGREGLPYSDFTVLAPDPSGAMWFGTHRGVVRYDGVEWNYRQGRRWLPDDDVRDIAVDDAGNAWFATSAGVGLIERRMMTLGEKAAFYEEELERFIRRTPFGYVSEVTLERPGDKTSPIHYHDSDNDGLWTSMYGAGECFAYAATHSPLAKERAMRAFEALRFLQKVTQGGEPSPPHGYVARTIRSVDLGDPNRGRLAGDQRERDHGDALWKVYEPRWPLSADGKWYWKSDTSSDELDGHYFFYPLYYDLVAEDESERERVREVVRDLTDHLIEHDFNLVDHDGTPTRWGIYNPDALNHDPSWWSERGLKSLSMLSYLAVAEHVTGDPKYGEHLATLVRDHAFATNAMIYKIQRGAGSGNQSDDEMAFMAYYNVVKYLRDDALRQRMLLSFYNAWVVEQPEMNPFFHFAYAAHAVGAEYRDQWGVHSLTPWDGWLEDSLATLKGFSLDRCDWSSQNSHRLDVVPLARSQGVDATDPAPTRPRGRLASGKVLPVENRHFGHWNTDPWTLDYGGSGRGLASGTVFLLPYYMGLYHGFIED